MVARGGPKNTGWTGDANVNTDSGTVPDPEPEVAFEAALGLLSTPLVGDDLATKAMEAVRHATMAMHLWLQKEKEDIAACQA